MGENKLTAAVKRSSVKNIFAWSKGIRIATVLIGLGYAAFTGLSLWLTLTMRNLIDAATKHQKSTLINSALLFAIIILIQIGLWYLLTRFSALTRSKFIINMRQQTLEVIMKKQYSEIENYHSGELVNRMFSDVNIISDGILGIIPPILSMATQLTGAFIILVRINAKFVLVLIVVAFLAFLTTLVFRKTSKKLHKKVQEKEDDVHSCIQESLQNIRLIKASESENRISFAAKEKQNGFLKAQIKRLNFTTFAGSGLHLVFKASYAYALLWGGFQIFNGLISYGTLTAILQLVGQIQSPFANMTGMLTKIYSTLASAERIKELYDLPDEIKTEKNIDSAPDLYKNLDSINFSNVSFTYGRGTNNVLSDVNFRINKGDFAAVTGLSGGGKSTMFLLMLGIYTPTEGNIFYNLKDKKLTAGADTRKLFSYVPQGNALFSGTVKENISMFCENASDDEIYKAAEIACIKDFIDDLPNGLDTVIGERGLGLSEGQAQRIAVARAILGNSPILLLDEATSALDEITEAKLLSNISALKNRTCFIVTHRKAALGICNKCIVLNDSSITVADIKS